MHCLCLAPICDNCCYVYDVQAPNNLQLQEDSSHLDKTLHLCDGPVTQKLKAFGEYLKEQVDPPLHLVLANNVQFWLEVKKLKVISICCYYVK